MQGEHLGTLFAHVNPQCVGEAPCGGFRGRIGSQHRPRKPGGIGQHVDDRPAAVRRKDWRECLTCSNHAVEVGFENLAGAFDYGGIKRTRIHAADPGVVDQQRHVAATGCRRTHRCGIRYVQLDRHHAWQVHGTWIPYAGVDLLRAAPQQFPDESQAKASVGAGDKGR